MKKYIFKSSLATLLLLVFITGCDTYNDAVLNDIGNTRAFSPVDVTAKIRNQTIVELDWTVRSDDDYYVVEFSADDPNFGTIFKTVKVSGSELPVQVALEGETLYSIRVKAVSNNGKENSKWTVVTANTLSEQFFLPIQETDIAAKEATLRWIPNSSVTKIVLSPGDITHTITAEEKVSGIATVTGLTPETDYQANLFNNTKKRGAITFKTGIDIGDGILVKKGDDLLLAVANAADDAKLFLEPGDYKTMAADGITQTTEMILTKSITISGIPGKVKPVLHYKITLTPGVNNVSLLNLDLDGSGIENGSVFTVALPSAANFGDILMSGCEIHDFTRSLLSASNAGGSKIASLKVENCIVTNVNTNDGAEFINVRTAYVGSIVFKNSTFNTCSYNRDFIRLDAAAGLTGTGLTSTVLIENCTLHNVANSTAQKRILYVRFGSNASTVRNTLFTNTTAIYTNQAATVAPTFGNNNYFDAGNFKDAAIASNKIDASGTTIDPGYANPATGNFTISNQSLIDDKIGDPRWIK